MGTPDATAPADVLLGSGWRALERTDWMQARACFEGALAQNTSAEGLEGLAVAAWWLDDAEAMFPALERAYGLYRKRGDRVSAARLATLLGIDHYQFRGEAAIGNGWFRRAHRLLQGCPRAPEHGWLAIWEGQIALTFANDPAAARALGARASELGRSLGLVDIEMTGLGLEGLALVACGETDAGMACLDEATAAAIAGEMSIPNPIGATCCIEVREEGLRHSVRIGESVDFEIEDVVPFGSGSGEPVRMDGLSHPAGAALTVSKATRSRISVFGIEYEASAGFSASRFSWAA